MSKHITIITGEVSGDLYGALLAEQLKDFDPSVRITGIGGERMRACGVETFLDSNELSVVGFWEAIVRLPKLRKALEATKRRLSKQRPDLLILIDYPGFNLRLAEFARKRGIKVMYYVSPQVWAWGRNRINLIKKNVDKMVVILPFEVDLYHKAGIDVTYVGHPLLDVVRTEMDRKQFFDLLAIPQKMRLVALFPGSRLNEVTRHMEPLLKTVPIVRRKLQDVEFVVATLPNFERLIKDIITRTGESVHIQTDNRYEALKHSDVAIVCSGTVTLEAALLDTPAIVIYRLALFSWAVGKMVVRVPYISLTNLVAGSKVIPEYVQDAVNPKTLASETISLLTNENRRRKMLEHLKLVRDRLGPPGASRRTAELALSLISG
ncbi:MAG TPA: lipid-A-disaccharide synthase [Firmicutes bacterium]|nr:lipid-A-disaccharide synthase [Bacillota bacterium]